jgi:hypothetical protein
MSDEVIEATVVEVANLPAVNHAGARALGGIPHLHEYMELAEAISKTAMVPSALRNRPAEVLAVVMYGAELGIGPMQAMQQVNFIEGKPSMAPELMRALIRQAGHKLNIKSTRTECIIVAERGDTGEVGETDFTIDDAVNADLCTVDATGKVRARSQQGKALPWEKYTKDLLLARATSRIARMMFSDVVAGMSYTPEEVMSFTPPAAAPTRSSSRSTTTHSTPTEETGVAATDDQLYAISTSLGLLEAGDKATVKTAWIAAGLPSLSRGLTSDQAEDAMQIILDVLNAVGGDVVEAEVVEPSDTTTDTTTAVDTASSSEVDAPLATKFQVTKIQTMLTMAGVAQVDRHDYVSAIIDRPLDSMNALTKDEAHTVIDRLDEDAATSEVH